MRAAIHQSDSAGNMTSLPATFEKAQTIRRMAIDLGDRLKRKVTIDEMLGFLIESYRNSEQAQERLEA